jgi:IclR family transcriptional regulator, acetate operon repressor
MPHSSAAGKAILATMTGEQVRTVCGQAGLPRRTSHTITDLASLRENLALVRSNGFALDDEEDAEGVFCLGAAFFGHNGAVAGAVSVTGIKGDLPAWRVNELGQAVRRAADRVSGILGGPSYADRVTAGPRAVAGPAAP